MGGKEYKKKSLREVLLKKLYEGKKFGIGKINKMKEIKM